MGLGCDYNAAFNIIRQIYLNTAVNHKNVNYLVIANSTVCKFKLKSPVSYFALVLFRNTRNTPFRVFFNGCELFEFTTVRSAPEC